MSELLEKIGALAFLAETDDNGAPLVNETIDATKLLEVKTEAATLLDELAEKMSAIDELVEKVETLQKVNQQLKLENINLTDVATGKDAEEGLYDGIVVE